MPIKHISEVRRLPRLGIVRLGEKRKNAAGKEYPAKLDYFNLKDAPALAKVFGEKPKALKIVLPHEDVNVFFPQDWKAYGASRGLFCKGDGVRATRTRLGLSDGGEGSRVPKGQAYDPEGEKFIKEQGLQVPVGGRFELPCPAKECSFALKKFCRPLAQLLFMVPDAPGVGCYQISTTSFNSMVDLNSYIDVIRGVAGRVSMIPLTLALVPKEVIPPGQTKKSTIYHLKLTYEGGLGDLVRYRDLQYLSKDILPQLESETPEDLYAHGGEALDQHLAGAPAKSLPAPAEPGEDPIIEEPADSQPDLEPEPPQPEPAAPPRPIQRPAAAPPKPAPQPPRRPSRPLLD